jgi:hypothetical protein
MDRRGRRAAHDRIRARAIAHRTRILLRRHDTGGGWWLIPRINDVAVAFPTGDVLKTGDVLSPLLLWWCLLHALSQIARYHSAEWLAALDPDDSRFAVPIEQILSTALAVVPRLVLLTLSPGSIAVGSDW